MLGFCSLNFSKLGRCGMCILGRFMFFNFVRNFPACVLKASCIRLVELSCGAFSLSLGDVSAGVVVVVEVLCVVVVEGCSASALLKNLSSILACISSTVRASPDSSSLRTISSSSLSGIRIEPVADFLDCLDEDRFSEASAVWLTGGDGSCGVSVSVGGFIGSYSWSLEKRVNKYDICTYYIELTISYR